MILTWLLICALPLTLLAAVVFLILPPKRNERQRISAWLAITFTTLSSLGGLWGMVIRDKLLKRSGFDYGYEGKCFLLAMIGGASALVWVIRSRKLLSILTLGASAWIGFVWMMVLETL